MEGKNQMVFKDKQFAVLQHCAEKLSETMVCVKDFYTQREHVESDLKVTN